MRRNRTSVVAVVVAALMAISSAAFAEHEPQDEDAVLNIGVDSENGIVAINFGDNDTPWECDFHNGGDPLSAEYGELLDGLGGVETLQSEGSDWEFDARDEHYVGDDYAAETGTTPYAGPEGHCGSWYTSFAGPQGQWNHGQFVRNAKNLLDMKGGGCVVRELAKMDVGKKSDDTMLKTNEVVDTEPATEGELNFGEGIEVDCKKPNEKPEKGERGNSANAPGKNKGD
ncbi:MAG: hypothetical protein R3258_09990 [Acidimicrobiia bacterium]|nr:hypothetical protein [Acidimicrobiia bacterium]